MSESNIVEKMTLPSMEVKIGDRLDDAIVRIGFAKSKSEARRLIEQGAVRLIKMIKFDFEDRIEAYLASDRQWPRHLRIQHAEYQRSIAKTEDDKRFWSAIIKRNGTFKEAVESWNKRPTGTGEDYVSPKLQDR